MSDKNKDQSSEDAKLLIYKSNYSGETAIRKSKPPHSKLQLQLTRVDHTSFSVDSFPGSLWIFKETEDVDVVHQHLPHRGDEVGESPSPLHLAVHHRKQQIGNQAGPYLRLDGIDTFTVEILQWKVLFQLLEEQLYLPFVVVEADDFLFREVEVVGQQRGVFPFLVPVFYHT